MGGVAVHIGCDEPVDVLAGLHVLQVERGSMSFLNEVPMLPAVRGDVPTVRDVPEPAGDVPAEREILTLVDGEPLVCACIERIVHSPQAEHGRALRVSHCRAGSER